MSGGQAASGGPAKRPGALVRLVKQSGTYTIGSALVKGSGIVLAFIHWNPAYLSVTAYGYLGGLQSAALLLIPVLGLGLASGLIREMAADRVGAAPFSAFCAATALALGGGGLLMLAAPFVAAWFDGMPDATAAVRLIAAYAAAKAIVLIPMTYLQAREKAGLFSLALFGEFALLIAGNLVFVVALGMGLHGALWALVASASSSAVVLGVAMLRRVEKTLDGAVVRGLLRFGAPLTLAALSFPLLHVGDRFLIGWLAGAEALGVYEAAAKVAGVVNMVLVQGFQSAFLVIGLKTLSAGEGARLHRRAFRHFSVVGCGFVLGLSLFAYDAIGLVAESPAYLRSAALIFPLALGLMAYGLYAVSVNTLYAHGYTRQVALGVMGAALLNGVLNLFLIPTLGLTGAALATLAAYAALAVSAALVSQRLERFRFPWSVLARLVAAITALYAAGLLVQSAPAAVRLGVRALLMGVYPLAVLALGVYTWREVVDGWHAARRYVTKNPSEG